MDKQRRRQLIVALDLVTTHTGAGIKFALEGDSHVEHVRFWPLANSDTYQAQRNPTPIAGTTGRSAAPQRCRIDCKEESCALVKYHLDKPVAVTSHDESKVAGAVQGGFCRVGEDDSSPDQIAATYLKSVLRFAVDSLGKLYREVDMDGLLDITPISWWLVRPATWSDRALGHLREIVDAAMKEVNCYRSRDTFNFVTEADAASSCVLFKAASLAKIAEDNVVMAQEVALYPVPNSTTFEVKRKAKALVQQGNTWISAETMSHAPCGDGNFNVASSKLEVGRDIIHGVNITINFNLGSSTLLSQDPGNAAALGDITGLLRQALPPLTQLLAPSHCLPLAAPPLEDDLDDKIAHDYEGAPESKFNTNAIAVLHCPQLEGRERVFLPITDRSSDSSHPQQILEFKPSGSKWVVANRILIPDAAAPVTALAAVCAACGTNIHLFYLTYSSTIQEMAWNSEYGWKRGQLFGKESPSVSPWSSLSALRSATRIKLFCQRDTEIYEMSYWLADQSWTFKKLASADKGSAIASTVPPWLDTSLYYVYFKQDGAVYECTIDRDVVKSPKMEGLNPLLSQCGPLAVVSWLTSELQIIKRFYYITEEASICERSWSASMGWEQPKLLISGGTLSGGGHIAALQMYEGSRIHVYYVSSESQSGDVTLNQIALGCMFKTPEVKTICSGFS